MLGTAIPADLGINLSDWNIRGPKSALVWTGGLAFRQSFIQLNTQQRDLNLVCIFSVAILEKAIDCHHRGIVRRSAIRTERKLQYLKKITLLGSLISPVSVQGNITRLKPDKILEAK